MRSRYSAFFHKDIDYLVKTHHPNYRAANERDSLQRSTQNTQWTNLIVLSANKGQRKDKRGTVEFVAAYREISTIGGSQGVKQLRERSQFVKESGQWFYTEGEMRSPYAPKRDQPCWCGSGKRYRQCHG